MLTWLIRRSLARPRLIAWACLWFAIAAAVVAARIPVDLLPILAPAEASVRTVVAGLDAEQVEQLVTRPVEAGLIGAPGVARVHSESTQGLSTITIRFAPGANPYLTRQGLAERLAAARASLPEGVEGPALAPMSAGGDILKIGFTSAKLSPFDLRDVVQWTVRPRLLAAAGVARVSVFGGQIRRLEVRARPGDLSDSDLGFLDILNAVRRATGIAGAGFIDTPSQRVLIEPQGQALTTDDLDAGQIQTPGNAPVRIGDVADVAEGPAPAFGDALIDGKSGVLASVGQQFGANTLQTTHNVERALGLLKPALAAQGVDVREDLDRSASFVSDSLRGIATDLGIGVALILIALLLFMGDVRAVLVAFAGIPLALLVAILAIQALGWTLNAMTLGGLAVALGVVIDDSVIDVENILADLRSAEGHHVSRAELVLAASLEVRRPVVFASIALIIAVAPLLVLPGAEGALLRPLAAAIVFATAAALFVAAAVTPGLAWLFLRHVRPAVDPPAWAKVKSAHGEALRGLVGFRALVVIAMVLAGAVVLVLAPFLRSEFLPPFHGAHLVATIDAPPSTSLEVTRDYGVKIADDIRKEPGVRAVAQEIGRDETGDESWGLEHSRFDIALAPGLDARRQDRVAEAIRKRLADYPGLHPSVETRFQSEQPEASPIFAVDVFGPTSAAIDEAAEAVAAALAKTSGARDVHIDTLASAPTVRVDLNFPRLALFGLSTADVLDTVQAAFAGERVARVLENGRVIDVAVSAQASLRRDPETVGALLLRSTSGISVPLSRVANVYLAGSRAVIEHDDGLLRQEVAATPAGGDPDAFAVRARAMIAKSASLAPGVFLEYQTAGAARADTRRALQLDYAVAAAAILGLLAATFDGVTVALVVVSVLLAGVGGVIAVLLTGGVLSVGAFAGFTALVGISMRTAILLIDRVEGVVVERQAAWTFETVLEATRERVAPVLMTSLLVALAVLPLALRAGEAGREVLGPMAIVVLGGLITSTLASLFLLPLLIHWFWSPRLGRRHRRLATSEDRTA